MKSTSECPRICVRSYKDITFVIFNNFTINKVCFDAVSVAKALEIDYNDNLVTSIRLSKEYNLYVLNNNQIFLSNEGIYYIYETYSSMDNDAKTRLSDLLNWMNEQTTELSGNTHIKYNKLDNSEESDCSDCSKYNNSLGSIEKSDFIDVKSNTNCKDLKEIVMYYTKIFKNKLILVIQKDEFPKCTHDYYFKVDDISSVLNIHTESTIQEEILKFSRNEEIFAINLYHGDSRNEILFITYNGIMRLLYDYKIEAARELIHWISSFEVLF
ncbi:MAG: hypothetical protein ACRCZI_03865 [Cetobacterium sp.]